MTAEIQNDNMYYTLYSLIYSSNPNLTHISPITLSTHHQKRTTPHLSPLNTATMNAPPLRRNRPHNLPIPNLQQDIRQHIRHHLRQDIRHLPNGQPRLIIRVQWNPRDIDNALANADIAARAVEFFRDLYFRLRRMLRGWLVSIEIHFRRLEDLYGED
jgi:hypothetical protein